MEIRLIGQGYNIDINSSLAKELIGAFQDPDYTSFKCLVAFDSYGGVSAFTDYITDTQFNEIKVIVGIDQEGTSKEALEEILSWGKEAYVYHSRSPQIFHPKIYLFEGEEKATVIIGSHNFTDFGLTKNIETSILVSFNKSENETALLLQVEEYFQNLLTGQDTNLRALSAELIEQLYETGRLPLESQRRARYDNKQEGADDAQTIGRIRISDLFETAPIQPNPTGFRPRRLRTADIVRTSEIENENRADVLTQNAPSPESWGVSDSSAVLIAQIGKGQRWKQVNFPISMFTNFFGATRGDNTYHINLRHVSDDGTLGEIENRQAVSVRSQNYRFEIGEATGDYPLIGRPIGVFVQVSDVRFLYHLIMPVSQYFRDIDTFLSEIYTGPQSHLKRQQTTLRRLKAASPSFPI